MTQYDAESIERILSENSLLHGREVYPYMSMALLSANNTFMDPSGIQFEGITIHTSTNRKSVMCEKQYQAYEREFGRKIKMPPPVKVLRGIGTKISVVGEVSIQIPFVNLNIIIDVDILIFGGTHHTFYLMDT